MRSRSSLISRLMPRIARPSSLLPPETSIRPRTTSPPRVAIGAGVDPDAASAPARLSAMYPSGMTASIADACPPVICMTSRIETRPDGAAGADSVADPVADLKVGTTYSAPYVHSAPDSTTNPQRPTFSCRIRSRPACACSCVGTITCCSRSPRLASTARSYFGSTSR